MNGWIELHEQHKGLRATRGGDVHKLRVVLNELSRRKHLAQTIKGRFTYMTEGRHRQWRIAPSGEHAEGRWSEPLSCLKPGIETAQLTLLAQTDTSNVSLEKLTIMIFGRSVAGIPFVLAAHLDEEHLGEGACSHAILHCHVGPSLDDLPKVRVPLPALGPVELFEWLLSAVLPGWEPVPWASVVEHASGGRERRGKPQRG